MFKLTNSNNIAVFLVQFRIVEILLSTKTEACKVKFGEFANQRSRIFGQRVPGRYSVHKDGGDERRPKKAENLHSCLDGATSMRKIEECQACRNSQ